jgi:hypothetical protein
MSLEHRHECARPARHGGKPQVVPAELYAVAVVAMVAVGCHDSDGERGDAAAPVLALEAQRDPARNPSAKLFELPELPRQSGLPLVALDGVYHAHEASPEALVGVGAIAVETHVYAKPDASSARLGQLRAGAWLAAESQTIAGPGCPGGFRSIKPLGFVCIGISATVDRSHPILRAATARPDARERLPYMYGSVKRGGPVYARIPTEEETARYEPNLDSHLRRYRRDKVSGASYGAELWQRGVAVPVLDTVAAMDARTTDSDIPWFLRDGATVPNLSGVPHGNRAKSGEMSAHNSVALQSTFLWQGRRLGVTTDLRVVPTDRLRPIRGSDYHGVRIGEDAALPFAIVRRDGQKGKRLLGGSYRRTDPLGYRSILELTGKQQLVNGVLHYETKDGALVDDRAASRVEVPRKMPGWAVNGERWIDINVNKQLLMLFEGEKPVYAALVSTGEAGLGDPETTKSTRRGVFRIHTKYLTTTMDSKTVGEEFELRDVPYVQYFQDGYALHAAYWHDAFGMPKSHGCINLAPEDARRIFFWTEPHVPEGWHGAAKSLTGTVVYIHE